MREDELKSKFICSRCGFSVGLTEISRTDSKYIRNGQRIIEGYGCPKCPQMSDNEAATERILNTIDQRLDKRRLEKRDYL